MAGKLSAPIQQCIYHTRSPADWTAISSAREFLWSLYSSTRWGVVVSQLLPIDTCQFWLVGSLIACSLRRVLPNSRLRKLMSKSTSLRHIYQSDIWIWSRSDYVEMPKRDTLGPSAWLTFTAWRNNYTCRYSCKGPMTTSKGIVGWLVWGAQGLF